MNKARIATIVIALLALVVIVLVLKRPSTTANIATGETWLRKLPDMDASGAGSRIEIIGSYQFGQGSEVDEQPLVVRCGLSGSDTPHEEYLAHLGDHWFVENRREWMVRIIPLGNGTVDVTARDVTRDGPPAPGFREIRDPVRTILSGPAAERLRTAWNDPNLWNPQSNAECLDGEIVEVQACISGRYAVRAHHCDARGAQAGKRLLQVLRSSINTPRVQIIEPVPPPAKLQSTRSTTIDQSTP